MDKVRFILTLLTIAIVAIPVIGIVFVYQNNLLELFVPPEIAEIADDFMGGDGDNGFGLERPQIVGEPKYDETTGIFSVSFEYTNSLPIEITIASLSGNIECNRHSFPLGNASLSEPVSIDAGETGTLTIIGAWTQDAMIHFENEHSDEENVDVVLANFAIDVSGILIELGRNQIGEVPNPAYQG